MATQICRPSFFQIGPTLVDIAQIWSNPCRDWTMWGRHGRIWVEFVPDVPKLLGTNSTKSGLSSTDVGPQSANFGRNLSESDQVLAEFGQVRLKLARHRPKAARIRSDFDGGASFRRGTYVLAGVLDPFVQRAVCFCAELAAHIPHTVGGRPPALSSSFSDHRLGALGDLVGWPNRHITACHEFKCCYYFGQTLAPHRPTSIKIDRPHLCHLG